jgi:hypothetical protein
MNGYFRPGWLGVLLRCNGIGAAASDPVVARWVATMKRHNPPIVAADGLTVNRR